MVGVAVPIEAREIEVEVVEIDGVPTHTPQSEQKTKTATRPWHPWGNRVRRLSPLWWPVALVLAIVGIVLLLTLGVAFAACYLVFVVMRGLLRMLTR